MTTGSLGAWPRVPGAWSDQLAEQPALRSAIAAWLPAQRWYAGKQRRLVSIAIATAVPVPPPPRAIAALDVLLCVVDVGFDDAGHHWYTVPLTCLPAGDQATALIVERPGSVIAGLTDGSVIADAMAVPAAATTLVAVAVTGVHAAGRLGVAAGQTERTGLSAALADGVRLMHAEQSNTSVLIGSALIAKLVRRLEPGPNPDAELPAHLASIGFEHAPGLAATLTVSLPGERRTADVLVVHDAVANEGDLWVHVLGLLADELDRTKAIANPTRTHPESPSHAASLAALLGRRTAELHRALSTPAERGSVRHVDVKPEPFTLEWQREMLTTLESQVEQTCAALADAGRTLNGGSAWGTPAPDLTLRRFAPLRTRTLDAARMRVHADLHLGQVLWTGSDIVFIDFEGEPGAPIEERRTKRDPLTDLAGLLRSFDYAGRSALDAALDAGVVTDAELPRLERERATWTAAMSTACTDAYLEQIAGAGLVPSDRRDAAMLLALHVLQKALYEIRYELANRPDWVERPLSAVTEMLTS